MIQHRWLYLLPISLAPLPSVRTTMSADKNPDRDDIPIASEHYQKSKFPSLVGFAVTGAKDGELVTVATWINCKQNENEKALSVPRPTRWSYKNQLF